jgi:hypothetical protein
MLNKNLAIIGCNPKIARSLDRKKFSIASQDCVDNPSLLEYTQISMIWRLLLLSSSLCFAAEHPLLSQSMLFQAEEITRKYAPDMVRKPPPSNTPRTQNLLEETSNWLLLDLARVPKGSCAPLRSLSQMALWDLMAEIGLDGVYLQHLKSKEGGQIRFGIDPLYGSEEDYKKWASLAQKKGFSLIGSLIGVATGRGADFALALKNVADYPSLYSLIEVASEDWPLLPKPNGKAFSTNIPWLWVEALHKKGYIPDHYNPYVKESEWNATQPIRGEDQKVRRWIYLRTAEGNPRLDWMSPTFATEKLAAGDALQSLLGWNQTVLWIEEALPLNARQTLSLNLRKWGAFSVISTPPSLSALQESSADLLEEGFTQIAAQNAILTQNAQPLKVAYRWMLEQGIELRSLARTLPSIAPLLYAPKQPLYREEELTDEALKERLMQGELEALYTPPMPTAKEALLPLASEPRRREDLRKLQSLLCRFLAWQPGVFVISMAEILGVLDEKSSLDWNQSNPHSLYASLPIQMENSASFASELKTLLTVRNEANLALATLVEVPEVSNRSVLILRYRLPNGLCSLLAVNFANAPVVESLEGAHFVNTNAINLSTGLVEPKPFESSFVELEVPPLSAKILLFQSKHF